MDKNLNRYVVWLNAFLARQGLQRPDGRPLYAYKVKDDEYGQLKDHLKGVSYGKKCPAGFGALWLLFASEWWKREYDGGAWAWSPLFDSAEMHEPDQFAKQEWVESASAYWKLADDIAVGKKHIGKVVVNGGLPLKLIREAGGNLSRLLRAVLVDISRSGVEATQAHVLLEVEAHKHQLPKSYQQKLVYNLLADTLMEAARLKNLCANLQDDDPIRFLDDKHPGWLDRFPLSMDGDAAHKLFSGLITHAVRFKNKSALPVTVLRRLRFSEDIPSRFDCVVDAVSSIEKSVLAQLLGCPAEELPSSFDLSASSRGQSRPIGKLVWVTRHYQIKLGETRLPDAWFYEDVEIGFGRYGQTLYVPEQLISLGPDAESPWVFENTRPVARLRAAGSCRIKDDSCFFAVPKHAFLLGEEVRLGLVGERVIYSDSSRLIHVSIGPLAFKIECQAQVMPDASELPRWYGQRLYEASNPSLVFVQKPSLPATSTFRVNESDLFWSCAGNSPVSLAGCKPLGLGSLICKKDGVIQSRQRVVCLPEGAGIEVQPSFAPERGVVVLKNWPALDVSSPSSQVSVRAQKNGSHWLLDVQSNVSPPPADFPLTIIWPGGKQELPRVPFPVEDVFFSKADGSTVTEEKTMRLDMLGEIKANLLTASKNPRWIVTMALESGGNVNGFSKQIKYRGSPSMPLREIRFFDLVEQAKKLMSMSADLDARIAVSVECSGKVLGRLRFTRYQYAIEPNFLTGQVALAGLDQQISVDLLDKARLMAIHLVDQNNRCELLPIVSEGVPVGVWDFRPERRMPGCWLIYPAKESQIDFRPVAWNVPEVFATPTRKFDGLRGILSIADRGDRMEALMARLNWLAEHPSDGDWNVMQEFVNAIGHVPLACFDTWVAMARCPAAIAMAILHLDGFETIASRIADELPFEWMLVSPILWRNAIRRLKAHYAAELGSDRALRAFQNEIEEKTERLRRAVPSLEFSLNYAIWAGLNIELARKDIQRSLSTPDIFVFHRTEAVVNAETSLMQQFLQRAALQNEGPYFLKRRAAEYAKQSQYAFLFSSLRVPTDDWKYSLIMVPFMVAENVIKGEAACWFENSGLLHAVREYRDFDPEWFDDAYQLATFVSYSVNSFKEQ